MNPAESAGTIDEGPFVGLTILLFVISVIAAGWRACIRRQEWKHHQTHKHSWEKNQKRTVVEAIQPSWAMNVSWAANKRFEVSEFKTLNSNSRERELHRARSRLYRSQTLQVDTRWKALAEIYTMHSFAPFSNVNFFVKHC